MKCLLNHAIHLHVTAGDSNVSLKIPINNHLWFNLLIANKAIWASVVKKNCHQKYWLLEGKLM